MPIHFACGASGGGAFWPDREALVDAHGVLATRARVGAAVPGTIVEADAEGELCIVLDANGEELRAVAMLGSHVPSSDLGEVPRALFVYGTLMRGQAQHGRLARHEVVRSEAASIEGRLLDLGGYPGALAGQPGERVRGEIVEVEDLRAALIDLDDYEDFRGYGVPGSLYRRVIARAHIDAGRTALVWTYRVLDPADAPAIASGDWRAQRSATR